MFVNDKQLELIESSPLLDDSLDSVVQTRGRRKPRRKTNALWEDGIVPYVIDKSLGEPDATSF